VAGAPEAAGAAVAAAAVLLPLASPPAAPSAAPGGGGGAPNPLPPAARRRAQRARGPPLALLSLGSADGRAPSGASAAEVTAARVAAVGGVGGEPPGGAALQILPSTDAAGVRKRPPPLAKAESEEKVTEDEFVFGNDGTFRGGGFKITLKGMVQAPDRVMRKDSDGASVDGVPKSTNNIIMVRSLTEFRAGVTLGAGANGRVYKATHMPTGRNLAIKVVNVYDDAKRVQLLKELETLSTHVSRFLVRFFGAFYDGSGAVHIALEYMDRGSLEDTVRKFGPVPEPVMNHIAVHCLRGLRFLHRHHVLHRDFKTANILLSRALCRAKLSDFGLARDLQAGVSRADTFVGTVAYMSPERLKGETYTYAGDVWGLGVSLVECALGRYPFERPSSFFDYIDAAVNKPVLGPGMATGLSADARDFIAKCTHVDPKRRPTAAELLQHPWITKRPLDDRVFFKWLDEVSSSTRSTPKR